MSDETILKALDLIQKIALKDKKPFPVRFYGGEPMLRFDKIKFFIEEARKRKMNLKYVIFSNGVVGNKEIADYCLANHIHLVRGCNGTREAQEAERPNTYDKYNEMTKLFHDEKGHRRMTATPKNVKYMAKGVREMIEAGSIGATPMPDYYADWTPEATKEYIDQTKEMAKFFVERFKLGKPFYSFFLSKAAACIFTNKKSMMHCSAGKGLHCLGVKGHLFVCHRFITESIDSEFCFGHVDEILNGTAKGYGPLITDIKTACERQLSSPRCLSCKGASFCELQCPHANYKNTGDLAKPCNFYCDLHEALTDIIMGIDKELRPIDPEWWVKGNFRPEVVSYLKSKPKGVVRNG